VVTTDRDGTYDPAVEPREADKTLGELVGEMTRDVSTLLRQEVQLAKTEAREEISRASRGAAMLAAAGVTAWLALLILSLAVAAWLDEAVHPAVALAIIGAVWVIAAVVLVAVGRKQIQSTRPLPQTVDSLKEDVEWAKQQMS
jgi:uncharacterized membrane protein YqjE